MKRLWWVLIFAAPGFAATSPTFLEDLKTESLRKVTFDKKTWLVFIQPSCLPCKAQLKALECVKAKHPEIEFLAVQAIGDSGELQRGLRPLRLTMPVLKGTPKFLAAYEANVTPTPMTVIVEKGGKVLERILGAQPCEYWMGKAK